MKKNAKPCKKCQAKQENDDMASRKQTKAKQEVIMCHAFIAVKLKKGTCIKFIALLAVHVFLIFPLAGEDFLSEMDAEMLSSPVFDTNAARKKASEEMGLSAPPQAPISGKPLEDAVRSGAQKLADKEFPQQKLAETKAEAEKKYAMLKKGDKITVTIRWGAGGMEYTGKYNGFNGRHLFVGDKQVPSVDLPARILDSVDEDRCAKKREEYVKENFHAPRLKLISGEEKRIRGEFSKAQKIYDECNKRVAEMERAHKQATALKVIEKFSELKAPKLKDISAEDEKLKFCRTLLEAVNLFCEKHEVPTYETVSRLPSLRSLRDVEIPALEKVEKERKMQLEEEERRIAQQKKMQIAEQNRAKFTESRKKLQKIEKEIEDIRPLLGWKMEFSVIDTLSFEKFPSLKINGALGLYIISLRASMEKVILITRHTSFQTTGLASMRMRLCEPIEVNQQNGSSKLWDVYLETDQEDIDTFVRLIKRRNKIASEIIEADDSILENYSMSKQQIFHFRDSSLTQIQSELECKNLWASAYEVSPSQRLLLVKTEIADCYVKDVRRLSDNAYAVDLKSKSGASDSFSDDFSLLVSPSDPAIYLSKNTIVKSRISYRPCLLSKSGNEITVNEASEYLVSTSKELALWLNEFE